MALSRYIFTTLVLLRPSSKNDETLATFSRPRILNYWIQRPVVPFVSLTVLVTLTFYLVEMSYFLPPKVSDVAPRQTTSLALPKKNQPIRRTQTESPQSASRGWMKKMMIPSRRPERGGTSREQGYWEQMEVEGKVWPRRRMTDSQYSMGDVSADSSHIARWNVPKDIPKEQPRLLPPRQGAVPAKPGSSLPPITTQKNRSWSWSPQRGSGDQISVAKLGGVLPSDGWNGNNNLLTRDIKTTETGGLSLDSETAKHKKQLQRRDALRARKARRRQRQSLRESGDFLGVQGVNPHTGELDAMSPTDSSPISTISHQETVHSVMSTLRDRWKSSRYHMTRDSPSKGKHIEGNDSKLSGLRKERKRAKDVGKAVRWKRLAGEWSSLQEPNLSPISASPNSRKLFSLYSLVYCISCYTKKVSDTTWLIGRPSHAQGLQQSVQNLSLEETQPNFSLPNDTLTFVNEPISHTEATLPDTASNADPDPLTRTSSNSTVIRTPRRQSIANPALAS